MSFSDRHSKIRNSLDKEEYASAEKQARKALAKRPNEGELQFLLARSLIGQEKVSDSIECLKKAILIEPGNSIYRRTLGEAYDWKAREAIKADEPQDAIENWKKCLEIKFKPRQTENDLGEAYRRFGEKLVEKGDSQSAEKSFREAVSILPENPVPRLDLAKFFLSADRISEAQIELKNLVEKFPKFTDGFLISAKVFRRAGDIRGAINHLSRVLELTPKNEEAISLQEELEKEIPVQQLSQKPESQNMENLDSSIQQQLALFESQGDLLSQAALLSSIIRQNSQAFWAQLRLAMVYDRLGKNSEALKTVKEYLENNPADTRAQFLKARCLKLTGELSEACSTFEELKSAGKANVQVFDELGQVYAQMGKFEEAKNCWNEALKIDPEYPNVLFNFGQLSMEQNDSTQARGYFDRAIQKDPFNLKFHYFAGLNLKQAGDLEGAKAVWNSSKSFLNPQDPYGARILRGLGEKSSAFSVSPLKVTEIRDATTLASFSAALQERTQAAFSSEDKSVSSDGDNYRKALNNARIGNYSPAIEGFNEVLAADPKNLNALMNLGNVYLSIDQPEEAAVRFYLALQAEKNNSFALNALSKAYDALGLKKHSNGIAKRIASENPNGTPQSISQNYDSTMKSNPRAFEPLTRALMKFNLNDEALSIIQSGVEENPENLEFLVLLGEVFQKIGNNVMAESSFRKAIALDRQAPLGYLKLGDLFADNQQKDLAFAEYRNAFSAKLADPNLLIEVADRFKALGKPGEAKMVIDKLKGMNLSESQLTKLRERSGSF
ncbi:tetratricopeptide repeat protein [bacterium]|nr:tetratricopeptide repeat protein [bacterium]